MNDAILLKQELIYTIRWRLCTRRSEFSVTTWMHSCLFLSLNILNTFKIFYFFAWTHVVLAKLWCFCCLTVLHVTLLIIVAILLLVTIVKQTCGTQLLIIVSVKYSQNTSFFIFLILRALLSRIGGLPNFSWTSILLQLFLSLLVIISAFEFYILLDFFLLMFILRDICFWFARWWWTKWQNGRKSRTWDLCFIFGWRYDVVDIEVQGRFHILNFSGEFLFFGLLINSYRVQFICWKKQTIGYYSDSQVCGFHSY